MTRIRVWKLKFHSLTRSFSHCRKTCEMLFKSFIRLQLLAALTVTSYGYLDIQPKDAEVTEKHFMDLSIGGKSIGRIVIGLFGNVVPKTVENFKYWSEGSPKGLGYKNSLFPRIIENFMIQGGDFENNDGTGGYPKWYTGDPNSSKFFDDENFRIPLHPYVIAMGNEGKNTNGSQFFIPVVETPWLQGVHVVFGRVLEGSDVVLKASKVDTDKNDRPKLDVKIDACGLLQDEKATIQLEASKSETGPWGNFWYGIKWLFGGAYVAA